jgi:hypothetical protein
MVEDVLNDDDNDNDDNNNVDDDNQEATVTRRATDSPKRRKKVNNHFDKLAKIMHSSTTNKTKNDFYRNLTCLVCQSLNQKQNRFEKIHN